MYYAICAAVFVATYVLNLTTITVCYHRGLAHRAVAMRPWLERFVARYGNWITGLDPLGWVCMHRLHHRHSDEKDDPHSPRHEGFFRLILVQLKKYERILVGLSRKEEKYTSIVADLGFGISWLNKKRLWWLPYAVHFVVGVALALIVGGWLIGAAYFVGMMSHPIQGWAVNAFGHAIGGRNFDTSDNSRNNTIVAWLIMGEGYQNNHHQYPSSAKFSYRWYEVDLGYAAARVMSALGFIRIHEEKMIPSPSAAKRRDAPALESA